MKAAQPEPARPSWDHQHAREVDTGMRTKPTGVDQAHTKGEPLAPSGRHQNHDRRPALPSNADETHSQRRPLAPSLGHETVDRGAERPQGTDQVRAQDEPLPTQCR
jgi:hypothetical protein